jgi:hypothetical protein
MNLLSPIAAIIGCTRFNLTQQEIDSLSHREKQVFRKFSKYLLTFSEGGATMYLEVLLNTLC